MNDVTRKMVSGLIVLLVLSLARSITAISASEDSEPPTITSVDTLLFENFNGPEGPFATNPIPGWTVIDSGVPEWDETSWSRYDTPPAYEPYWNGDLARVLFDGPGAIADWLISPIMDCSEETSVTLSFKQSHSNSATHPEDTIFVFGSIDNGQTWPYTVFWSDSSIGALNNPDTQSLDISSWAAGNNNIKIAFCFKGSYVLSWYIDEPTVIGDVTDTLLYEDFNGPWGPFGNNPPAGWTIINEVVPDPPNRNDWSRWYYSTWPDTVACAYDNVNSQTANEWLITPVISFSETAVCSLSFYNSYWDDSWDDTDSAFVWGSTDNGSTWDHLIVLYTIVDDRSIYKEQSWRGFDISSWAQNQSNVKIGFHYIKDDPSYIGWWFFDDLFIYETVILTDNIEAVSIDYPTDIMVVGQDYNPQVTVRNMGSQQQTFDVNLIVNDPADIEVYNYTEAGIVLDSLESTQVTFTTPFSPASEGDFMFTAVVINPGDQDPSDDTTYAVVTAYEHQGTGGPDDYGYSFKDNTVEGGPVFNWIDISGTGTQIEPTLHYFMSEELPIGFDFDFYGETYSSMWVNSYGSVHIGMCDVWLMTNDCPLPDTSTPHAPMAAVFWDGMHVQYEIGQGVYYQYFDEDVDYTVIQWKVSLYNELDDSLEFEVILYEDSSLLYQYNYIPYGLPDGQGQEATVGLEYDVLPSGISYLCDDDNPANRLVEGLAIKWSRVLVGCDFVPGDANGDGNVMGNDVTYSVRYFKGLGVPPPDSCWNVEEEEWLYSGGDANGNCAYTGSDVTFLVAYFKGYNPEILWCPDTPPMGGPVVLSRSKDVTPVVLPEK